MKISNGIAPATDVLKQAQKQQALIKQHNLGRHEDLRLITGTGQFTADWNLAEQLHASVIRSDIAHGSLSKVNLEDVKSAPGVICVLTAADVEAAGFKHIPGGPELKEGEHGPATYNTLPLLADNKVCFVGQAIAMVIAESANLAHDAAALADIEYEELPALTSSETALASGAPSVHATAPNNISHHFSFGDKQRVDTAFSAASKTCKLKVLSQRLAAAPMEPRACNASFTASTGVTTVYTPAQGLHGMRGALCAITGLEAAMIDIVAEDVGGSFGVRSGAYPETALVMLAAQCLSRPVKWVATRSELFIGEWHGRGLALEGELAVNDQHQITAIRFQNTVELGAFNSYFGGFIGTNNLWVTMGGAYQVPALCMESKLVYTNTLPISAYRGAGRPDIAFAIERLIDHAAAQFDIDSIEFRRQNFIPANAFPYTTANGTVYDCGDFHSVLKKALELADYDGFPARSAAAKAKGKISGIGIGYYVEKSGAGGAPKDEVSCRFQNDGHIILHAVTGPSGQGHETTFAQIVAQGLGVSPALISYRAGDSTQELVGNGTGGSRSLYGTGSAFKNLVNEIVERALPHAAAALQTSEDSIEFSNGKFSSANASSVTLVELAQQLTINDAGDHPFDCDAHTITGANYPNGCHIAEILIDPATGLSEVTTYTSVDDLGNVINQQLVEGQVHGGVIQGVGQAFGEEIVYDETGQLLSGSFMDYAMPRAGAVNEFRAGCHPVPTKLNELGAKGVGESGCSGSLPAISNAVMQALRSVDADPIDMPYTAEKLWRAINAR